MYVTNLVAKVNVLVHRVSLLQEFHIVYVIQVCTYVANLVAKVNVLVHRVSLLQGFHIVYLIHVHMWLTWWPTRISLYTGCPYFCELYSTLRNYHTVCSIVYYVRVNTM